MTNGLFIAIEGVDGSGKKTQTELLQHKFESLDKKVFTISFPRYGSPTAKVIERYLHGEFGNYNSVAPDLISLAYAIDRFSAARLIRGELKAGNIVIADRYVASNLAHQGTKLSGDIERKVFYDRIMQLEYETLGIPRPSLNIVLLVPGAVAQLNVDQKDMREYTDKKRDVHEADANHLELAKANYTELCDLYPDEFAAIECMKDTTIMRSIDDIHADIWKHVEKLL